MYQQVFSWIFHRIWLYFNLFVVHVLFLRVADNYITSSLFYCIPQPSLCFIENCTKIRTNVLFMGQFDHMFLPAKDSFDEMRNVRDVVAKVLFYAQNRT